MPFRLVFAETRVPELLLELESDPSAAAKLRKIRKALAQLEVNPRHPGLQAHRYQTRAGPNGEPIWEAYVENQTPGAWRIWFWYGPEQGVISVLAIGPHPD